MNLQTVKPRARWNGWCWIVEHVYAGMRVRMLSCRPHDSAVELLMEYVLPRMIERSPK